MAVPHILEIGMIVRISHPQHGYMHVYSQTDLDKHIALGWSVYAPAPPVEVYVPEAVVKPAAPRKSRKVAHDDLI